MILVINDPVLLVFVNVNTWQMLGHYLINAWPILCQYLTNDWLLLGQCLANTWSILGQYLVNTWPMLGMRSHTRDLGMNSHSFLFFKNLNCAEAELCQANVNMKKQNCACSEFGINLDIVAC